VTDNEIVAGPAGWTFGDPVPETFVQHARRSIPGYDEGHALICQLSDFFCHHDSVCYELGASTGQLLRRLAEYGRARTRVRWVGIDREADMVSHARRACASYSNIELHHDDILTFDYEPTDFVVAYYTLQFVPPRVRQQMLDRVFKALNWGGGFVMFEKVRGPDARFQDMTTRLYDDYKRRQGFSAEEILSKARSLKGVLEPFSSQGNRDLLERAGFVDFMTIYKNICFEGFLAIK
jgi:tRNA (cmo5U34)-methyltransferase